MDLRLTLRLTPHGRLHLDTADDAPELDAETARRIEKAFARGVGSGLLHIGAAEIESALPPVFAYFREFGGRYMTSLCTRPDIEDGRVDIPPPSDEALEELARAAPVMPGAEYVTADVLRAFWREIGVAFAEAFASARAESGAVQDFLKSAYPAWNLVGRVHFNLAENRKDETSPFAFVATYTGRLSAAGRAQHTPLGQALREYAGAAGRSRV